MANFLSFGNYAGESYGYDFKLMQEVFKNNPGLLPANGTTYSIPAILGGGVGTFNASDYTIRNSVGQVVGSINWNAIQINQSGTVGIGLPSDPR